MKKYVGIMLIVGLLFLSSVIVFHVSSKEINTISTENTLYVGGSGPGNYTTIDEAVDFASDGDTIFVYNGTYGPVFLRSWYDFRPINLVGESPENTIIDGFGGTHGICVTVSNSTIKGFTIKNATFGIDLEGCSNVNITNNIITDAESSGIFLGSSNNINIFNNIIKNGSSMPGNGYCGITISGSQNHINNNMISNFKVNGHTGIGVTGDNNVITNNTITDTWWGIDIEDGKSNEIKQNIIENSGVGIFFYLSTSENEIIKNEIINNIYGINIAASNCNIISQNQIKNHQNIGIRISGSDNNEIYYNNIENNNETGIYLEKSMKNKIKNNNFKNNQQNAFFIDSFGNTWFRNYWGKPKFLPYIIHGKLYSIKCINIDFSPSITPIKI